MTASVANERPQRKLLSEELDRLDSIIDSLAEGLPEAVAAAAREGTRQAVQSAIIEIVSNPELRSLLQMPTPAAPAASEPVPARPSLWSRIKVKVAAAKMAIVARARAAKSVVVETFKTLTMIVPVKKIAIVTGVGVIAALAIQFAPAGVSAAICAVAGAVAAGLVRVGDWFRRSFLATG